MFRILLYLASIIVALFILKLIKNPKRAFYLFIFFIPLAEIYIETKFLAISIPNILILIIIVSLLARFLITKPNISLSLLVKMNLFALFFLINSYILAGIQAIDVVIALRRIITAMGMTISFVLPLILIRNLQEYRKAFLFLIASASLLALFTILAGFGYFPQEYKSIFATRAGMSRAVIGKYYTQAFIGSRGGYGCWLESAIAITVLSIFCKKFFLKNKLILTLAAFLMILGVIIPSSRSTWLATSSVIFVILLFVLRTHFRFGFIITLIISLATILTLYQLDLIQPFIKNVYEMSPNSVEWRFLIYRDALRVGIENPIFGIGSSGYELHLGSIFPGREIHNVFLSTFVSNGILGVIPLIFIWVMSLYLCIRTIIKPVSEAVKLYGVSMFAGLIGILIEIQFYGGGDKIMWLMLGLTNCLYLLNGGQKMSRSNIKPLVVQSR